MSIMHGKRVWGRFVREYAQFFPSGNLQRSTHATVNTSAHKEAVKQVRV